MTIEAHWDAQFPTMVNGADLVTPDGMPLAKVMKLLYGIKQAILKFVSLSDSEKIKMQQNALHSFEANFSAATQLDYFKTIYDLSISNKQ